MKDGSVSSGSDAGWVDQVVWQGQTCTYSLYASFTGGGIWQWNGTGWTKLTPDNPAGMVAAGANLYGNFAGNGIWQWNGSVWSQLTPENPASVAVGE